LAGRDCLVEPNLRLDVASDVRACDLLDPSGWLCWITGLNISLLHIIVYTTKLGCSRSDGWITARQQSNRRRHWPVNQVLVATLRTHGLSAAFRWRRLPSRSG